MDENNIFHFSIPGHTSAQKWAVYIIVASHHESLKKYLYVGKVGDNRVGCNPIISRIGNHFSYNKDHSQMRNKLDKMTEYNYDIHYATFSDYLTETHIEGREIINEIERRLNKLIQEKIGDNPKFELRNPYIGKYHIKKTEKYKRAGLLNNDHVKTIEQLATKAIKDI
jgi:hypothetical protein